MKLDARPLTIAALATFLSIAAVAPQAKATGAVLPPSADPFTLDVEVAVAKTPYGTTRWSRVTVAGVPRMMWLVPVRPGAAVDWASDAWLGALDQATALHVTPPNGGVPPECPVGAMPERIPSNTTLGARRSPQGIQVHATEPDARAHMAAQGYKVTPFIAQRLQEAYAGGYQFVSLDFVTGGVATTTPTVRVSDDGPAILPLALTGSSNAVTNVSAFILGDGPATVAGAQEMTSLVGWDAGGSTYTDQRADVLAAGMGNAWLRETATHDAIFFDRHLGSAKPVIAALSHYFRAATGQTRPACEANLPWLATDTRSFGRVCPAGDAASIPGGAACVPVAGELDAATLRCGAGADDAAIAFAGLSPSRIVATRLSGIVPVNALGSDVPIGSSTKMIDTVRTADHYLACQTIPTVPPGPPVSAPPSSGNGGETYLPSDPPPRTYDTCGGSSAVVVGNGVSTAGGGSSSSSSSSSSSDSDTVSDDSCSGDSSTSSSSSSDDASWDSSDSSDNCSDDSSSSSASDSCSCDTKSTSSSDSEGWDDADMTPKKKTSASMTGKTGKNGKNGTGGARTRRGPSPVSRYALLFVALILPLRRSLRNKKWTW